MFFAILSFLSSLFLLSLLLLIRQIYKPYPIYPRAPFPIAPLSAASSRSSLARIRQGYSLSLVPPNVNVIVIGSGIGGLSSAAYLAKAGYKVIVLEQHDRAGGCTHTYEEKGFEFDVGVHYVGGDVGNPRSPFRRCLEEVTEGEVEWKEMATVENGFVYDRLCFGWKKEEMKIRAGTKRFKQDLIHRFPSEREGIEKYFRLCIQVWIEVQIYLAVKNIVPSFLQPCLYNLLPLRNYFKYVSLRTKDVLESLTSHPTLLSIFSYIYFDFGSKTCDSSFVAHASAACYFFKGTSYPVGGPSTIAKAAVKTIEKYGGKVLVRARVKEIIVEEGKAKGVVVERNRKGKNGEKNEDRIYAPIIISAVGADRTFRQLIPSSHHHLFSLPLRQLRTNPDFIQSASHLSLFLGFEGDPVEMKLPSFNTFHFLSNDVVKDGEEWTGKKAVNPLKRIDLSASKASAVQVCSSKRASSLALDELDDPTFTGIDIGCAFIMFCCAKDPTGAVRNPNRITCQVLAEAKYEWFKQFGEEQEKKQKEEEEGTDEVEGTEDLISTTTASSRPLPHRLHPSTYSTFKHHLTNSLLRIFFHYYPHLRPHLVHYNLGTPLSSEYYLGSVSGSSYGLAHTPGRLEAKWLKAKVDGVEGLYLSGQDVTMAGIYGGCIGGVMCAAAVSKKVLWNNLNVLIQPRLGW